MEETFCIYYFTYDPCEAGKMKEWLEECMAKGYTKIRTVIGWGYYNDIDELYLKAEKP